MDTQAENFLQFIEADAPRGAWSDYLASGLPEAIGGFHLCLAINCAWQSGMIDKLRSAAILPISEVADNLDTHMATHLIRYLSIRGVLKINTEDQTVALSEMGMRITTDIALAQLGFYLEAYSPVLARSAELITGRAEYGVDVHRNGTALGVHCATLFRVFHTPIILDVLRSRNIRSMVDLGCGAGMLLIDACLHESELTGHGLDISSGAIEHARELTLKEGLSKRLSFSVADAFDPATWPAPCSEADAICAVGTLHEHFRDGEEAVINILNTYAELLEQHTQVFILGEPELYYDDAENDADLYFAHIFTAQGFPRRRNLWLELIERSRLTCRRLLTRRGVGPRFCFYELSLRNGS